MKKVYYIAETDFSRKNATGVRIIGCSKAIEHNSDNKVTIIGFSNTPKMEDDGFEIYNVKRGVSKLEKVINTLTRPKQFLNKIEEIGKPDVIIYYAIYGQAARILNKLKDYCRKNSIKLVVDITEWYDYKYLPYGKYGSKARDVEKTVTKLIPTCDGVIAISSYLENYYKKLGVNVIRVPLILDTFTDKQTEKQDIANFDNSALNLIYAGFAGKKELIINVAKEVVSLYNEGYAIKLNILGLDGETFAKQSLLEPSNAIVCHGKINQKDVVSYLQNADFSIIIRQDILNTRAGFPTKFVESFNAGLPVIANITSDLGDYLIDCKNGIVVDDCKSEHIKASLLRALAIDKKQLSNMKVCAKETASKSFDYRVYSDKIKKIIENV